MVYNSFAAFPCFWNEYDWFIKLSSTSKKYFLNSIFSINFHFLGCLFHVLVEHRHWRGFSVNELFCSSLSRSWHKMRFWWGDSNIFGSKLSCLSRVSSSFNSFNNRFLYSHILNSFQWFCYLKTTFNQHI